MLRGKCVSKTFPVRDDQFQVSTKTSPFINCVSVARTKRGIAVRDTKDKKKTTLYYNKKEWNAFIQGVKLGEFDI